MGCINIYTMKYNGLSSSLSVKKRRLNIDSSSRCNLSCPGCGRTKWINAGLTADITDMNMDHFCALMRPENNVGCLTYNLSLSDPIYSGVFIEQLEYVNTLANRPQIQISTNGSGRNEKWWLKLSSLLNPIRVRGESDRVEFAIDGLQDTNHLYRRNSNWDSIMLGVRTLRSNWPGPMIWRYVIFEHNYHQVTQAQTLAKQLGFDRFRPVVGDGRTPKEMLLRSKTWEEIANDLSEMQI